MELQTKENSIQELKMRMLRRRKNLNQKRCYKVSGGYGGLVWKFQTPSKDCRLWHVVYP